MTGEVAIDRDIYGNFLTKDFDPNYNRNNYGAYDENALASQGYRGDLIPQDEYGQNYNIVEPDLNQFKDRLKTTRKSRFTDTTRGPTYTEIAARRATRPTVGDQMWDAYNKTTFGDQYQIQRGKRKGDSAREVECGADVRLARG
jgi:hypothetical protein